MSAACPTCGGPVDLARGPARPFCSERCRLLDLGAWLTDGERTIAGEPALAPEPPPAGTEER